MNVISGKGLGRKFGKPNTRSMNVISGKGLGCLISLELVWEQV
jgi:hypothetical protein